MEKFRDSPSEDTEPTVSLPGSQSAAWWRGIYGHVEGSRDAWTKFRAQDLERCSSVGGEYVLKRQYMELQPPEML